MVSHANPLKVFEIQLWYLFRDLFACGVLWSDHCFSHDSSFYTLEFATATINSHDFCCGVDSRVCGMRRCVGGVFLSFFGVGVLSTYAIGII